MAGVETDFGPLRRALLDAAERFASDAQPLAAILEGLVSDTERALAEPLEIFPVAHHSPSSAVHMVSRLRSKPPRVIYLECCEDLQDTLSLLEDCKLPIALQAFAPRSPAFPAAWAPLSVVCPITEFSAEQQVIAHCLQNPGTELVFVDRSVDHIFQAKPQEDDALDEELPVEDDDEASLHGAAVGVQVGALEPTFAAFREHLMKNARVAHFSEWWDQYVEEATLAGSYAAYRQVFFLVGSLFRRLGVRDDDRAEDEMRERYMWTRIRAHLREHHIDPADALYVCGAAHAASRVEEFGVESRHDFDIPARTDTEWLYGVLPSSYAAVEHQFAHPRGFLMLAQRRYDKALKARKLTAYRVTRDQRKKAKRKKTTTVPSVDGVEAGDVTAEEAALRRFLETPPPAQQADEQELVRWSAGIVALARKNGYLASTADAIAVYQTSVLLARMRNRAQPSPYDFRDAAITCIEKDREPPGKRNVSRLCDMLLGGDRTGQVGYESLPPLARDVYDRLEVLPIAVDARTVQRALLDFEAHPEYLPASDLLWKLRYLIGDDYTVRPIMGERTLGAKPKQESWDVAIGKRQGAVIELGYEGITVEHVLERRLKRAAFAGSARCLDALTAAEDSILFLDSHRLTEELGEQAVALLPREPDLQAARAIYRRISRLIHFYRAERGLPLWAERFVTTGYSHYCTLLPESFADRGVSAEQLSAMLEFILTLESLALSLGCERSQLLIAVKQSHTDDKTKLGLLWSVQCVLSLRDFASLRTYFDELFDNDLALAALPDYLSGFLLALAFTPLVAAFTVELMSKAFERLPDHVLMPWVPKLLMTLKAHGATGLPTLLKEATAMFPRSLAELDVWQPPWLAIPKSKLTRDPVDGRALVVGALLREHPATTEAMAAAMGLDRTWQQVEATGADPRAEATRSLLATHPDTLNAVSSSGG